MFQVDSFWDSVWLHASKIWRSLICCVKYKSKMQFLGNSPSSSESLCIYFQSAVLAWERRYYKRAMVESFKTKDLSLIFLLLLLYVVGKTHQGSGMKGENNSSQDSYPLTEGQDQGRLFYCPADFLDPAKSTPPSTSSILYLMFHLGWSESEWFLMEWRKERRQWR